MRVKDEGLKRQTGILRNAIAYGISSDMYILSKLLAIGLSMYIDNEPQFEIMAELLRS